eukprot:1060255-Heterocapsa_arctica.AAC.1
MLWCRSLVPTIGGRVTDAGAPVVPAVRAGCRLVGVEMGWVWVECGVGIWELAPLVSPGVSSL